MKAMNLFKAVMYALVPALGRRYQMRNEAWRNHVNEMQKLIDRTRIQRNWVGMESRCRCFNVCYGMDFQPIDEKIPAYPEICR